METQKRAEYLQHLEKKQVQELTPPRFRKTHYNHSNQTARRWRDTDRWNREDDPEMRPHLRGQFIFKKGLQSNLLGKQVFSTNSATKTYMQIF